MLRRGAGSARHLVGSDAQLAQFGRAQFERATVGVFDDMDSEAALHATRPGNRIAIACLSRIRVPGGPKTVRSRVGRRNCPSSTRNGRPPKLSPCRWVTSHRLDLVGVDLLLAQRGQAGRSTVQQHAGRVRRVGGEGDTGLEPATGAERSPAAHRHHTHDAIIPLPGSSREGQITAR